MNVSKNTGRLAAGGTAIAAILALSYTSLAAPPAGTEVAAVQPASRVGPAPVDLTPQPYERELARIVAGKLTEHHYERRSIDDATSRKWLDNYLDFLDYGRNVFLQSDVDGFQAEYGTKLDDLVNTRTPDLSPAVRIYEVYQRRLEERVEHARAALQGPMDLTNAESYAPDRHELPWPATAAEANELWRQRVEEDLIEGFLDGRDDEATLKTKLGKRYERSIKNANERESVDVLELWLLSLARTYDPHSIWFAPAASADFDIDITNSVEGIGAQLSVEDEYVVVKELITGGPAEKSGQLAKEDRILAVAQGNAEPVDVVDMKLEKVVSLIRGPKETVVKLTVQHKGAEPGQTEVIALTRARVTLESSAAEAHVEEVDGHKLGYLTLPSFYVDPIGRKGGRRASQDVKAGIEKLKAEGVEGIVFDLRGNGGGSLVEAIDVAGAFLPRGPVVQVRDRQGRIEALFDADAAVAWTGPLVVLTDAHSASASEIVAGALQDYGRAVVVGDSATHGKGTVQQVVPLTEELRGSYDTEVGGDLKMTVQKFYRVSGGSTQNKGVAADVVLPSILDGLEVHEADLPSALPWDRIPPAPHVRTGDLAKVLPELQARSQARVAADEDFAKLAKYLSVREQDEERNAWSLVLEERKREYEERKALFPAEVGEEGEDGAEEKPLTPEEKKAKEREADYRLDEGLAVLKDLVTLLADDRTTATE